MTLYAQCGTIKTERDKGVAKMAMYNMSKEIREIAELTGKPEEQVAEELDMKVVSGEWTAYNRREEHRVKVALADARRSAAKEKAKREFEQKLAKGAAVWRKISGEWLVQVTGREVKKGEIIKVERRDGSISEELVKCIVTKNDDGVFVRV